MRIILIKNSGMHLKAPILARCMLSSTTSSRRHNQHSSGTLPEPLIHNSWPMLFLPSSALSSRMPNSGGSQLILGNADVSPMAFLRRYRFGGHIIIQWTVTGAAFYKSTAPAHVAPRKNMIKTWWNPHGFSWRPFAKNRAAVVSTLPR